MNLTAEQATKANAGAPHLCYRKSPDLCYRKSPDLCYESQVLGDTRRNRIEHRSRVDARRARQSGAEALAAFRPMRHGRLLAAL